MGTKIIATSNHLHWETLIYEAAQRGQIQLPQKSYEFAHHILENLIHEPHFSTHHFLITHIESTFQAKSPQSIAEAADHCLVLLGLFPNRLAKFHMDPDIIITTGQSLYRQLDYHPKFMTSTALAPMVVTPYHELIELMLNIHAMIWSHEPLPKDFAYQLWQSTGSRYAQRILHQGHAK